MNLDKLTDDQRHVLQLAGERQGLDQKKLDSARSRTCKQLLDAGKLRFNWITGTYFARQ